jgi:hypothetical protein
MQHRNRKLYNTCQFIQCSESKNTICIIYAFHAYAYISYILCVAETLGGGGMCFSYTFHMKRCKKAEFSAAKPLKTCAQTEKSKHYLYRIHLTFIFICFMLVHSQKISQQKVHYFDEEKKHRNFYTLQLLYSTCTLYDKIFTDVCAAVWLQVYILAITCFIFMIYHN